MYGEQTNPVENDAVIDWDYYKEIDHTESQEALNAFIESNLTVQKYIRRDYEGYLDFTFTSEEPIDHAVDADLEHNEPTETDEYDQEGDDVYHCSHCDKRFEIASDFTLHAINWVYQNKRTEEMTLSVMRPNMFLSLLVDHVWNSEIGKTYQEHMETFVRSKQHRLHDFFIHMVQQNAIPHDIWDKYNELLAFEDE